MPCKTLPEREDLYRPTACCRMHLSCSLSPVSPPPPPHSPPSFSTTPNPPKPLLSLPPSPLPSPLTPKKSTTTTTRLRQVCVALCAVICCLSPVVDMSVHGDHGSGAAKRRRERRLRMHWRNEQLTLRMVLATVEHHSYGAPRGQLTATRTRAEERETYSAPRRQEPPLPAVTTGTQYFTLDDESVPLTGCGRPVWSRRGGLRSGFRGTPWSR